MKKILTAIMLITIMATMFAGVPAYAADTDTPTNAQLIANERTDVYALDEFRHLGKYGYSPDVIKQAQTITAGVKDDYAKVKAIHDWVANNIWYNYDYANTPNLWYVDAAMVFVSKSTTAEGYANLTASLAQAVGFPAKVISGYLVNGDSEIGHVWTEVYVNDKWLFIDATLDTKNLYRDGKFGEQVSCISEYFDMSLDKYSQSHKIDAVSFKKLDEDAWNGSLQFYDVKTGKVLKEVKNFPLNGLVNDTYGFNINDLYTSYTEYTEYASEYNLKLNTMKVDSRNHIIWVNTEHEISSYYVGFRSNGGTIVSSVEVVANSLVARPANPTKKNGAAFIGWYKDAKCTQAWNFATDKVTDNTILYAGWSDSVPAPVKPMDTSKVTAVPTSSKVLVNGKSTAFEAYNINGNNYFKLRDLAKVVSGTDKQFEITWDGKNNAINLISGKKYTVTGGELGKGDGKSKTATLCTSTIYKDGAVVSLTAYTINGNNYFKLRDVAQAFNILVTWDGATNTVGIDTTKDYTP